MARWHISIEDETWSSAITDLTALSEITAESALHGGLSAANSPFGSTVAPDRLEASLCFLSDVQVQVLNRDHRGKDNATNVLSFAAFDDPDLVLPPSGPVLLGDVVFAHETIQRESEEAGITLADHTRHMITHGVLHLLGYDHECETDAVVMEDLERDILRRLGVADPYPAANALAH